MCLISLPADRWQYQILTMIIIALKGAFRDFYNLLTAPQTVSCAYAEVCKSRAAHRTLTTCNRSCATWYEGTTQLLVRRDSSAMKFDRDEIASILGFFFMLLAETVT